MTLHQIGAMPAWFACADVAAWLAAMGFVVQHESGDSASAQADEARAEDSAGCMSSSDLSTWDVGSLPSITSPELAQAFAGLRGWDRETWAGKCGDPPKWMAVARGSLGAPGVAPATWNPIVVANSLIVQFSLRVETLRARFQTDPSLRPWLSAWIEHEATYFPGKR